MNSYPSTGLTTWYSRNTLFFINSWVKWQDVSVSFPRKELQHNNNTICLPATHDNTIYRHVDIYSYAYFPHAQIHFFFSPRIYFHTMKIVFDHLHFKSRHIYESMVICCVTHGTGCPICKPTWTLKHSFQNLPSDNIKIFIFACVCAGYKEE